MARVLIVDDEAPLRQLLTRIVRDAGHEADQAETAEAALEVMAANPAAVVFCDVQMPGQGGVWLTMRLREQFPASAMVLATGVSTVPPAVSMRSGIVSYLLKPFGRAEVISALEAALAWHLQTVANGPRVEDGADRIEDWLEHFE
ncbi:MAG: response regulator [Vicinamibacterales bacterium]